MSHDTVSVMRLGPVTVVAIHRPEQRDAVDPASAQRLREEFDAFDSGPDACVAVLMAPERGATH